MSDFWARAVSGQGAVQQTAPSHPQAPTYVPARVAPRPPTEQPTGGPVNGPPVIDGRRSYREVAHDFIDINDGKVLKYAPANGEAARSGELDSRCPRCHSLNIFSRRNVRLMGQNGAAHAKGRCFECGWTEDFIPGEAGNWS